MYWRQRVLICGVFFTVIAASKPKFDFQFLAKSRLLSDFEAIAVPVGGGERYAHIVTYRTSEPLEAIIKKAERELLAKGWSGTGGAVTPGQGYFYLGQKTVMINTVSGGAQIYISENRASNFIDRVRIWMKSLWKKSKK